MYFSSTAARLVETAGLWGAWCVAHSLVTEYRVINKTGLQGTCFARYYRFLYVCMAGVTLAVVYLLTPTRGEVSLWAWKGPLKILQLAFWVVAFAMGYFSFRFQDIWIFLGVRSLLPGWSRDQSGNKLITHGIYGVMRHPQFAAGLLFLWTRDVTDIGLVINLELSTYLLVAARLEEKKLVATFGEQYREYRRKTPAFVPRRLPSVRSLFFPPDR
jgi:protein-S-isoprenylcysteine O-methyltransferase Ste14